MKYMEVEQQCFADGTRRNGRRPSGRSVDSRRRPCFRVEFAYPKGSEKDERAVAKPNFEVGAYVFFWHYRATATIEEDDIG